MKAHQFSSLHISWYMYQGPRTSPGAKVKVICKGQGQISGSCFSKDGCFGGISRVQRIHSSACPYWEKLGQGKWIILLCLTVGRVQNGRWTSKNSEILWTLISVSQTSCFVQIFLSIFQMSKFQTSPN